MPRKELTATQRERIVGAYKAGNSFTNISRQLNFPISTVHDTVKRYKETGSSQPQKRPGRPKTFTARNERVLQRIIREDRFAPLGNVTSQLNVSLNTQLHLSTVRKYLHNTGINSCTARRKPLLTEVHRKKRLQWCREHLAWDEEWKNVVWSDESRFALFESDGRVKVWRKVGEAFNKDCVKPTVKFGGVL